MRHDLPRSPGPSRSVEVRRGPSALWARGSEVATVATMTTATTSTASRARRDVERVLVRLSPESAHNLAILAVQRRTTKSALVEELIAGAVAAEQSRAGKAA